MERSICSPLAFVTIGCALAAAVILIWFMTVRPALVWRVKIVLFFAIFLLPLGAAMTGNVAGYQASQTREFCSSCHVMTPYTADASDAKSTTLAALHGRNARFGGRNCYVCHENYGMYGAITTKVSGLRHVYEYFAHFRTLTIAAALPRIQLYEPYANQVCMECHSTELPSWQAKPDHGGALAELRAGTLGCASPGCHGPVHPFSKATAHVEAR